MTDATYSEHCLASYGEIAAILKRLIDKAATYPELEPVGEIDEISVGIARLMLRSVLVRADGIQQLISSGSGEQATILMRSLIEAFFGLAYLCKDEQSIQRKATAYRFFHFVQQHKLCREATNGDALNKIYDDQDRDTYNNLLKLVENQMSQPCFTEIKSEYEIRKENRKRVDSWFNMFNGPVDIRMLSRSIDKEFVYILYKIHCGSVHSSDGISNVTSTVSGVAITKPLRWAEKLPYLCRTACSCVTESVLVYLQAIQPSAQADFKEWYHERMSEIINDDLAEDIQITIRD